MIEEAAPAEPTQGTTEPVPEFPSLAHLMLQNSTAGGRVQWSDPHETDRVYLLERFPGQPVRIHDVVALGILEGYDPDRGVELHYVVRANLDSGTYETLRIPFDPARDVVSWNARPGHAIGF